MDFQLLEVAFSVAAEHGVFLGNYAYAHLAVGVERAGDYIFAVQLRVDYARAYGEAVQADEQVEEGRSVAHHDVFRQLQRTEKFLREVERIVLALLENEVGVRLEVGCSYRVLSGEGVFARDKDVRACAVKLLKGEVILAYQL